MNEQTPAVSNKARWTGYVMTALPVLLLLFSGVAKIMKPPEVVKGFVQFGFAGSQIVTLGIVEIVCTLIYLIPATSILGAILLTGYLGGAVFACACSSQPIIFPAITGVLVWGGLFMRDRRIRDLIPIKR